MAAPDPAPALLTRVYDELRTIARRYLGHERAGHTLEPTALVHEAWLRLNGSAGTPPVDRGHFVAIAANVMRRVLVDHARLRAAKKRGDGVRRVTLSTGVVEELAAAGPAPIDLLMLDDTLAQLARLDARQAQVVELKLFGGFSMEEIAAALGVSKRSAEADWTLARAFLRRELAAGAS